MGGASCPFLLETRSEQVAKAATDIRSLARSHTALAIRTLVGVAAQRTAPQSARVAAATALLDRGWGKPKQELEINQDVTISLAESLARIAQLDNDTIIDITPEETEDRPLPMIGSGPQNVTKTAP